MSGEEEKKPPARRGLGRRAVSSPVATQPQVIPGRGAVQETPSTEPTAPVGRRGRARAAVSPAGATPTTRTELGPDEAAEKGSPVGSDAGGQQKGKELVQLAHRPGPGTVGRPVTLWTNYFKITVANNKKPPVVYRYDLSIEHEAGMVLNRDDKRYLFYTCVNENPRVFVGGRHELVFDGMSACFSFKQLRFPPAEAEGSNGGGGGTSSDGLLRVTCRLARMTRPGTFTLNFVLTAPTVAIDFGRVAPDRRDQQDPYLAPLQFIDILIRQCRSCHLEPMASGWHPFARTLYRLPSEHESPFGLTWTKAVYRGLFGAARVGHAGNAFVNLDLSHSAFYKPVSVLEFMVNALNDSPAGPARGPPFTADRQKYKVRDLINLGDAELSPNFRYIVHRAIKGRRVTTTVRRRNGTEQSVTYSVASVSEKTARTYTFEFEGAPITVEAYFAQRYGQLAYPNLPLLEVGSAKRRQPTFLPMEVCTVAENQKVASKLDRDETAAMIKYAAKAPATRKSEITNLVAQCQFPRDPWLSKFGVQVAGEMEQVKGRILAPPAIRYADQQGTSQPRIVQVREGVWDMKGQQFYRGETCQQIGALLLHAPPAGVDNYMTFLNKLGQRCQELGVGLPGGSYKVVRQVDTRDRAMASGLIEQALTEMRANGVTLVIVTLPYKGCWEYNEVKRLSEIVVGLMTQCVVKDTMQNVSSSRGDATLTNLAMKINAKLGGLNNLGVSEILVNSALKDPQHPTLVIGVDVTHPAPYQRNTPSVAAMVGNVDDSMFRYSASVRVQRMGAERVQSGLVSGLVKERLAAYLDNVHRMNQGLPEGQKKPIKPDRILVLRDGVSEGQFATVLSEELAGIRNACNELDPAYKPKVTFMVAQKGHHTRFFPTAQGPASGKHGNVVPGTVVDTGITHPQLFEFYICSHFGVQGTSRPIRYHVLLDQNHLSSDQVQACVHYLCHVSARCTRAVSLPAPIFYADLVCRRVRAHLYDKVPDFGSDTMSMTSGSSGSGPKDSDWEDWTRVMPEIKKEMYFA